MKLMVNHSSISVQADLQVESQLGGTAAIVFLLCGLGAVA